MSVKQGNWLLNFPQYIGCACLYNTYGHTQSYCESEYHNSRRFQNSYFGLQSSKLDSIGSFL